MSWATHKYRRLLDLLVLSITHLRVSFPEQMVLLLPRRSSCGAFGNGTALSENTRDFSKRSVWTIKLVCWDSSKLVPTSTVWVVLYMFYLNFGENNVLAEEKILYSNLFYLDQYIKHNIQNCSKTHSTSRGYTYLREELIWEKPWAHFQMYLCPCPLCIGQETIFTIRCRHFEGILANALSPHPNVIKYSL